MLLHVSNNEMSGRVPSHLIEEYSKNCNNQWWCGHDSSNHSIINFLLPFASSPLDYHQESKLWLNLGGSLRMNLYQSISVHLLMSLRWTGTSSKRYISYVRTNSLNDLTEHEKEHRPSPTVSRVTVHVWSHRISEPEFSHPVGRMWPRKLSCSYAASWSNTRRKGWPLNKPWTILGCIPNRSLHPHK